MQSSSSTLLCRCSVAGLVPPEAAAEVADALRREGVPFQEVDDLCGLAARRSPLLVQAAGFSGELRIFACYPRAVRWLFAAAGAPLPLDRTELYNLRSGSIKESLSKLQDSLARSESRAPGQGNQAPDAVPTHESAAAWAEDWQPWFPVIDFARCNHCMQCLSFCLFSVYGVDKERRIAVLNPENCKANCPACSRVCPEAAIIFPKFPAAPINGDEAGAGGSSAQPTKVDISALLGGDVYGALRARSGAPRERFSPARDPETALQERRLHLAALKEFGELPPEALENLPPPEELKRRAEAAKALAERALAARGQDLPAGHS